MQSPEKNRVFNDREIRTHTSILMIIMNKFCDLLDQLEDAIGRGQVRFQGIGRSFWSVPIVKRRCIELLATMSLNLNHWPNPPVGFKDVARTVNKVCDFLFDKHCC